MIDFRIGKLIEYPCGHCFGIKDLKSKKKGLVSNENFISYSGCTREKFNKNEFIKKLLRNYEYIPVSLVNNEIQKINLDIKDSITGGDIWEWFQYFCTLSLKKYGENAYIYHSGFSAPHGTFYS